MAANPIVVHKLGKLFLQERARDYDRMAVREFLQNEDLPTDTALFAELWEALGNAEIEVTFNG